MTHLICIGAQRAATTWLHRQLSCALYAQSDAVIKEVHYFNQVWMPHQRAWTIPHRKRQAYEAIGYWSAKKSFAELSANVDVSRKLEKLMRVYLEEPTDDWYRRVIMAGASTADRLSMDFTPEYAILPVSGVEHMRALTGTPVIVFILRNPIERAFSHLLKLNKDEGLDLGVDGLGAYLDANPDVIARSDYKDTIDVYADVFGAGAMHLVFEDDIKSAPRNVLTDLIARLGYQSDRLDISGAQERIHVSSNRFRYRHAELPQLKEIFWSRFSDCYNKLDGVPGMDERRWRHKADAFLEGLCTQ